MLSLILALAVAAQDTAHAVPADAYADSGTAQLLARARAARERNERLVTSYTATVTQRMAAGIHALSRDRMLFHQELIARIEWHRDAPSRIEVQGARQAVPVAIRGEHVPEDLQDQVRWLVANPAEDYIGVFFRADSEGFVYPLGAGAERDYRYAAGDTSRITLPNGHEIRLIELRVMPRRSEWRLIVGSIWFDADSYGPVRVVFRPARPYDFRRDAEDADRNEVPRFINPTAEVKYITLEYGLYESRWWMPRFMALDVTATIGSMAGMPFRIERVYSNYHVEGGTPPVAGSTFRPAGTVHRGDNVRRVRAVRDSMRTRADSLRALGATLDSARADSIMAKIASDSTIRRMRLDSLRNAFRECMRAARDSNRARARRQRDDRSVRVQVSIGSGECSQDRDSSLVVVIAGDSTSLLTNPGLGPPILEMGDVISEGELRQIGDAMGALPQRPWDFRPDLPHGVSALIEHLRYNRVEALSIGLGGNLDFGRLSLDGLARIGIADGVPNGELGLTRPARAMSYRLGAYRRLAAANPDVSPFDFGSSVSAFLIQRDDGEYFRTLGAELTGKSSGSPWLEWRVYAERQRSAAVKTQFSLPHLLSSTHLFRPNLVAQSADEAGASVTVRGSRVVSRHLTVGSEVTVDGATGTFDYGRGALTLRTTITPGGPLAFGAEAAAGISTGAVPVQSGFFLGGPMTLRGYNGAAATGATFWRGRLEVGNSFPAFRLVAFGDAGWAGPRAGFTTGRPLVGAGLGLSVLDGLIRLDLARALRPPTGWRMDFYFDAAL